MAKTQRYVPKKRLDQWLGYMEKNTPSSLPPHRSAGYAVAYSSLAAFLDKNVLPEVPRGALLAQVGEGSIAYDDALCLNDHGPEHVNCVIDRASDLVRELKIRISPYEAYLLLAAIHVHDAGIVFGRDGHETSIYDIMGATDIRAYFGDSTEARIIGRIAAAHGGRTAADSRDTIGNPSLLKEDSLFGQDIRPRFLASLLRLSDELADDRTRASRFLLASPKQMPRFSELFHAYSHAVASVGVKGSVVKLRYEIVPETGNRTYVKAIKTLDGAREDTDVYLLDEIYSRTTKMHQERMYCMQFWPPDSMEVDQIDVEISAHLLPDDTGYAIPEERITYTLRAVGYPDGSTAGVPCCLCLRDVLNRMTGLELQQKIQQKIGEASHGLK